MTASTKSIADVLDEAADLIAAPGAWCRAPFAIDCDGNEIYDRRNLYPGAVAFCAAGTITRAAGGDTDVRHEAKLLADSLTIDGIIVFNDEASGAAEVVAKLREAATKARAELVA